MSDTTPDLSGPDAQTSFAIDGMEVTVGRVGRSMLFVDFTDATTDVSTTADMTFAEAARLRDVLSLYLAETRLVQIPDVIRMGQPTPELFAKRSEQWANKWAMSNGYTTSWAHRTDGVLTHYEFRK